MRIHRHRAARAAILPLLATLILAAALIGCATSDDLPIPDGTTKQTEPVTPSDPFEPDLIGQWQKDTVTLIITAGKSRTDVDDTAVLAALIASNAEAHWFLTPTGPARRNLFGWSIASTDADPGNPTNDLFAINMFYDRAASVRGSDNAPLDPVDLSQRVQIDGNDGPSSYFEDRPSFGELRSSLSTPEKSLTAYRDAFPASIAAFDLMSP